MIAVRSFREPLFSSVKAAAMADNGHIFQLDLVIQLIAKRALSTSTAFVQLVEQHNLICATVLLRTQIDSLLRLHAFWLVSDPQGLAMKVISGEHISKIKDKNGEKLRDGYLVESLAKEIEWLERVYKRTSGLVHLSSGFIGFVMRDLEKGKVAFDITEIDVMPPEAWDEVIDCFIETSSWILHYIDGWAATKAAGAKSKP